ncbi:MAG: aldolase [Acidiphilium sp.]|nr:aldolase [Acidiphilium sp.]MDD4935548.1 aldolase [Acidiphilium sp.]
MLLGPPSSGKSDLLLRLLDRGFELVGDDQLVVENGRIRSAAALSGLIELHGLGIFQIPYRTSAMLRLAVALSDPAERLPMPGVDAALGVPAIVIAPETASAAIRVHWALDAACGRKMQHCGAFAA